jgi:hypothetical protein
VVRENFSKLLKPLEDLQEIGLALPAFCENLPANRKLQGDPGRETVLLLTASSATQSGLRRVDKRLHRAAGQFVWAEAFQRSGNYLERLIKRRDVRGPMNFQILQIAHGFDNLGGQLHQPKCL